MAKYSEKAGEKVEETMHEMKEGKLKSGTSGKKVTSKKQAVAIGLSEARKEGAKVPKKKEWFDEQGQFSFLIYLIWLKPAVALTTVP